MAMTAGYRTLIVVPCYNEARRLDGAAFEAFLQTTSDVGLCFVDDGSTDDTFTVLTELARGYDAVDVHRLERNAGKAEAVRQGILRALEREPEFVGYWDNAARHYVGRLIATAAAGTLALPVYDTQCGAKLLRAAGARPLFERAFCARWMFDVELIARIIAQEGSRARAGLYLREIPLKEWRHVRGSKIRVRDGVLALRELYRIYKQYPARRS